MAAITESAPDMADATVKTGTRAEFMIFPPDAPEVQAIPPADPQSPTLGERLFYRMHLPVERSDALSGGFRPSAWRHVDDTISTFAAGDAADMRSLLLKLYNQARADTNL